MIRLDLFVGITCTLILLVIWVAYFNKKNNFETIFGKYPQLLAYSLTVLTLVQIGIWVYYFIKTKNNKVYDASYAILVGSLFTILPLVLFFGINLIRDLDSNENHKLVNNETSSEMPHGELSNMETSNNEMSNLETNNGETSNPETANFNSTTSADIPEKLETATN